MTWSVFLTFLQLSQLKEIFSTASPSWFLISLSRNQKIKIPWKGNCNQFVSCNLACRVFVNFLFNYGLQSWNTFIVNVQSILYLPMQNKLVIFDERLFFIMTCQSKQNFPAFCCMNLSFSEEKEEISYLPSLIFFLLIICFYRCLSCYKKLKRSEIVKWMELSLTNFL